MVKFDFWSDKDPRLVDHFSSLYNKQQEWHTINHDQLSKQKYRRLKKLKKKGKHSPHIKLPLRSSNLHLLVYQEINGRKQVLALAEIISPKTECHEEGVICVCDIH